MGDPEDRFDADSSLDKPLLGLFIYHIMPPSMKNGEGESSCPGEQREVVWVNGAAINVAGFNEWHPGGDIIAHFIGRDATTVFQATHPPRAQAWLKSRTLDKSVAPPPPKCDSALRDDYVALHKSFTERGWLSPTLTPLVQNVALASFFMALALWFPGDADGRVHPILLGFFIGMGLHQLAFTVHDSMHGMVFSNKKRASAACTLLGDLGFGVVADHWDYEHVAHHVMSNCVDHDLQQRNAPIITVDLKQLTVKIDRVEVDRRVEKWLLRVNHWFWLLAATWGGRFALQGVGTAWVTEKLSMRYRHALCLIAHYTWLVLLIRARSSTAVDYNGTALGPWLAGLTTVLTAGMLHIQLLVNHASRPMHAEEDAMRKSADWVAWQSNATADIACPSWMDWFHGGLQFQITHHLFPRMPSHRLRAATPEVYKMLKKNGLDVHIYDGLSGGIAAVTHQLASACEASGHKPWPPVPSPADKLSGLSFRGLLLQIPNVFWIAAHIMILVVLPFLCSCGYITVGMFVSTFGAAALFFLVSLFAPLLMDFVAVA